MREPSPPFEHVSWREEVEHDAATDVTLLAETVMGRDAQPSSGGAPGYLAKIARYPLWAISVRALFGAALIPLPMFLYAGTRYHYFASVRAQYHVDQNALLAGVDTRARRRARRAWRWARCWGAARRPIRAQERPQVRRDR